MTCRGPKLEVSGEDAVVSRGFGDDICWLCGGHFLFLDLLTDYISKHTDEVCCHLCPTKFSHINSLALHIKSAHPMYGMFCKSCNLVRQPPMPCTMETQESPEKTLLEEVEEVIIENEEVEIKYMKVEEEEEEVVGMMEETEENSITKPPECNKMMKSNLQDHNYFSTHASSSVRDTANNVVMYTSNENVLVFINNKTGTSISQKDAYTESDQQVALVGDQTVIHDDHTYFSSQRLATPMHPAEQKPAHNICSSFSKTTSNVINPSFENIHVFHSKLGTGVSPEDTESSESIPDQKLKHELVCSNFLDHNYASEQSLANHPDLLKQVPSKEDTLKYHKTNVTLTAQESTKHLNKAMLQLQLGCNIKMKDVFKPVQNEAGLGKKVESIQRSDHVDSQTLFIDELVYVSQDGLCSETSLSAGQKQSCNNLPLRPVSSVNVYPAGILNKDLQMCACCGRSKEYTEDFIKRCRCKQAFTCSLCEMVFGTEQTLQSHQAVSHPLAKYICSGCLQLFPNQKIFLQHGCSKSTKSSGESFTSSNISNNSKEPSLMLLKLLPLSAAAEYPKQSISCPRINITNTPQNLRTVSNSKLHSLPNLLSTSGTQKAPVHDMTTRSSVCTQKKKVSCCTLNGELEGIVTAPVSTVTLNQKIQLQVLKTLQAKVVTQMFSSISSSSSCSSSSLQNLHSTQTQGHLGPLPTVTQIKSELQTKVVIPNPPGSKELTKITAVPQQQQTSGVNLPQTSRSKVSSTMPITIQRGQLPEDSIPFLNMCIYSTPNQIIPSSQEPLKIMSMFVNQSRELALQKRMRQSWRSKAVFPCRQCGAVSRQFSLGVRHRYQHRGPRLYRCQCGRTFHQRMHLLRHQVQHAETTRYVCAACGQMFCGTKQLGCHRPLFSITQSNRKKQANQECRNMFQCYCGHSFTRPAALLWHMLINSKAHKPGLKSF